jgi:hypothetical protein
MTDIVIFKIYGIVYDNGKLVLQISQIRMLTGL